MSLTRPKSIGGKLILLVTLTSGVMTAVVCAVLVLLNYNRTRTEAIENVETLARTTAVHSASTLEFADRETGAQTLSALRDVPEVTQATIYDTEGSTFAVYHRDGGAPRSFAMPTEATEIRDGWLVHRTPISNEDGQRVGDLQLVYNMAAITDRLRNNVLFSLLASLLVMAVGLLVAARLQSVVTRPIRELVATARRVSERRDFSLRARKVSTDELGTFTDEFNDMLEKLQHQSESLDAAHQRFRIAVEAAPNAMVMVDDGGEVLLVNRQTEQMFGYEREELIGQSIDVLVPDRTRDGNPALLESFFDLPSSRPMGARRELFARRKDGSEFPVEIGLNPINTDEGLRVLSSIVDITERRHAEQERAKLLEREREAREQAEQANRMKDEFLATLSHELRTPMTAILGWAKILRTQGDAADLKRGLEVIERNAGTQAQIIEDLLDMSRIISGKVRLDVQNIDLHEIITGAITTVQPAAEARGVRLHSVLDSAVGPIKGDANRLQQVMWNLISNAIKFTPRGGRVQVALERVNSHVEISVSDSGQGIAAEFLPHVFERFRQADSSTTRRHGGLGLGLAIVKQLVELHGGSVHAKSPGEGKGSTFIVALPLSVAHTPRLEDEVHPRISRTTTSTGESVSLTGTKVLVVDDEPDARELIGKLLERAGASVLTLSSASEALDEVHVFSPNVLVSDIGMPIIDGYDLIRQLRARPASEGGATPAIALTAFARSEDRTRSLLAGYQLHVAKPVEPSELIASVATLAGVVGAEGSLDGVPPGMQLGVSPGASAPDVAQETAENGA